MSNSDKKDRAGRKTPSKSTATASAAWFTSLRPRDTFGNIEDVDIDLQSTPEPTEVSPLKSWIDGYDNKLAAAGRENPPITSAYARPTHTPAAIAGLLSTYPLAMAPVSVPTTTATNVISPTPRIPIIYNSKISTPKRSDISRTSPLPSSTTPPFRQASSPISASFPQHTPQLGPSHAPSIFATAASPGPPPPRAPIASPVGSDSNFAMAYTPPASMTPPPSYIPPRISSPTFVPPELRFPLQIPPTLIDRAPSSHWDSSVITRDWTQNQVRIAIKRIMSEINMDWYEYNYLKFDFDGSIHVVLTVWREISIAYTEYMRSRMIGLDMLTLIAMNGGTLENVKHVLADMICFFAAGKIGMENRAEEMAKACITGGDIVSFVRRRCAENGLTYPGGTGLTEQRIALARSHGHFWQ